MEELLKEIYEKSIVLEDIERKQIPCISLDELKEILNNYNVKIKELEYGSKS
jgi:hypothetical protein